MAVERDLFGEVASPAPPVRRFGRRLFLASPVRRRAEELRRQGKSLEVIAKALGIGVTTLRVRLKAELESGLPGGRGPGRPTWRPSADDRAKVAQLAAELAPSAIAVALGVSPPTLRKHCAAELAAGRAQREANAVCRGCAGSRE